ncbi:M23 family metallopeptidase [Flectobacillus major]|uniref:M23 family metallopeptidase n=1 Tax=Flectobacillus major TaxID=103 RepID=UPI000693E3C8|nr:M23 family metallopeptidase [Flectobacillus major]
MKRLQLILFLIGILNASFAQKTVLPYPKGYFLFPINPNQRNYLAGGMGDLRSNHFHAGIDIKTQGREGLPVYAAADGYISDVRVQAGGYGNVVFITHPNGYVTVYGHLKSFAEPLAQYVRQERLKKQTFEIALKPAPNEFKVTRGQIIGLSGNTGGSAGPHLHFEIRDLKNNILNPLNFGFKEIIDNVPPVFQEIIIKSLSIDSRVMGEFGTRKYSPTKRADGSFTIANGEVLANGIIGIELLAVDKMNDTHNSNGLSCVELLVDNNELYYYHLEQFPDEHSNDINIHIDYPLQKKEGQRIQKLFQDDGNTLLPVYKPSPSKGKIHINDGKSHVITIKIWDTNENLSTLHFTIKGQPFESSVVVTPNKLPVQIGTAIDENTLVITAKNLKTINSICEVQLPQNTVSLPIAYTKNNQAIYLWDLRKGIPQVLSIDSTNYPLAIKQAIFPKKEIQFSDKQITAHFNSEALYDTLYLETNVKATTFQLGQNSIPLKKPIQITFKPDTSVAFPDKTSVYTNNKDRRFLGGKWSGNRISFKTDNLGHYQLLTDSIPPKAALVTKNKDYFAFKVSDNLSGIRSFRTTIDGNYILCDYDYKKALVWSVKSDSTQSFIGKMVLELTDNQGNTQIYSTQIDSTSHIAPVQHKVIKKALPVPKSPLKTKKKKH